MNKFRVRVAGEHLVVHSHLPPIGSAAFRRFTRLHLIQKITGPTHAQIGVTAVCPQRCGYCYNRGRTGQPLDSHELHQAIEDLHSLGIVWLGFTGGEPLLHPNLEDLIEHAARKSAVKIFTTGHGLTVERARALGKAGCFSIAISLDDWREPEHDAARGVVGAYATALAGVRAALEAGNLHVSVSSVVSTKVIRSERLHELLDFLRTLGVHEAWLSEPKPAAPAMWGNPTDFTEDDRQALARAQDTANQKNGLTVNYLGHFEAPEHFGCNAGKRMVYVDPWGEVSPCVFVPLSMGNLRTRPLAEIYREMCTHFPSRRRCFVHENHEQFRKHQQARVPLGIAESLRVLAHASPATPSDFIQLLEASEIR
jgi:MoaA/NifB/PqqE/SkfB family radical SAM enzyme